LPSKGGDHTLPIVPQNFEFKPRDESAGRALKLIGNLMAQARQPVVATDAEREGELIAYEVITRFNYKGTIKRCGSATSPTRLSARASPTRRMAPRRGRSTWRRWRGPAPTGSSA
jgi:DNA topoisomerase IA